MPRPVLLAIPAILAAAPAFAHPSPVGHGSLASGFTHPLFGLDHVLAMVAVGLWAASIGGHARWIVPATFVATMLVGFALALTGLPLPGVEPMILASVVALGVLVAAGVTVAPGVAAAVVAVFALFHGHAHGSELGGAGAVPFAVGFALATAALHAAGIALFALVGPGGRLGLGRAPLRLLGGATALGGAALALA